MNPYEQAVLKKGLTESHRMILRRITPSSNILEVGPSVGHMSRWLAEKQQCRVIGIENDPDAVAKSGQFCNRVYAGSVEDHALLEQVKAEQGLFDFILFADVLEHLMVPERTLTWMKELLKPSGRLLASIPNIAHVTVRMGLLLGRFDYQPTGILDRNHIRFFTKKTAIQLFTKAGFEVIHFDVTIRGLPLKPFWKFFPGLLGYQFIIEAAPRHD